MSRSSIPSSALSPVAYLETHVFPVLLPALEALLKQVSPPSPQPKGVAAAAAAAAATTESESAVPLEESMHALRLNINPILFLAQYLTRRNRRRSSVVSLSSSIVAKTPLPASNDDLFAELKG